ncbi:MAG: CUAEP/CCAEP-tail radical SAM (seleno)protein [Myxococcota bacterium]
MRADGDVLLVSCYALGHQPLSLAGAQGALRAAGFRPRLLDTSRTRLRPADLAAPRLIAISVPMHTALRLGAEVAQTARALGSTAVIVCFGLYAPLNEAHLRGCGVDVVLGPENVDELVLLARLLDEKSRDEALREFEAVRHKELRPRRPGLEILDRQGLPPLTDYVQLRHGGRLVTVGYAEGTRGCKHVCRHCPITPVYQGRFFALDRATVLDDISRQVAAGAGHITFGDPDFLNGPTHALRLVRELHTRHPDVTWDATIKVEHILKHRELFTELKSLGCLFVVSAVESLSPVVLDKLHKRHGPDDIRVALQVVRDAGITLRPTFVAFTPWTGAADYLEMARFILDEDLLDAVDPVQLAVRLLIPPRSALLEVCQGEPWLGPLHQPSLSHIWTHPDPRMDALAQELADLAAEAAGQGEDSVATMLRMLEVAQQRLGVALKMPPQRPHRIAPGLTENWFC